MNRAFSDFYISLFRCYKLNCIKILFSTNLPYIITDINSKIFHKYKPPKNSYNNNNNNSKSLIKRKKRNYHMSLVQRNRTQNSC